MNKYAMLYLGVLCTANAALGSDSASDAQTVAELQHQVAELKNQVDLLTARIDDDWLTEARAEEIRGLVQEVLADADTRASLLQGGAVAGYDKNFFVGSADGNYLLKFAGQMQFRAVYNNQDEASSDSSRFGFENRRTKLRFFGHVVDPSWQYLVLMAAERDGGSFVLDEAFIAKDLGNGWKVRFGQFKPPFLREELVSSSKQLAVERSLVNEEFNQDRVQGVELEYKDDQFRVAGAYSDGFFPGGAGTDNTGWHIEDTEYAFTGRAEFLASGDWKQFEDFSGWRGEKPGVLLGGAFHYQQDEFGTGVPLPFNNAEVEALHLTGDVSVKLDGVGLYGALVYRSLDAGAAAELEQLGFVLQGSVFLSDDVEVFARYEWGDFEVVGIEDLSVVTVGVNKYFNKHNLKWQTDIGFGLEEVASVWSTSSAGWRTDPADEGGQVVVRSQFQLLF